MGSSVLYQSRLDFMVAFRLCCEITIVNPLMIDIGVLQLKFNRQNSGMKY